MIAWGSTLSLGYERERGGAMAAQQAFVVPIGDAWVVKVNGTAVTSETARQATAIDQARQWLLAHGGGELVVLGEDGRIRQKDTIGRPDPRGSRG